MKRASVCLSVCPSVRLSRDSTGLLLSAVQAGNIDRQRHSRLISLTISTVMPTVATAINVFDKSH